MSSDRQQSQMPKRPRIYLDHNATSPVADGVLEAVTAALMNFGNPSSPHFEGRLSKSLIEKSRKQIADSIGADPPDIVFTSGGTESNHLGLIGLARSTQRREIVIPGTVHPSLAAAAEKLGQEGFKITQLGVTAGGRVDLSAAATVLGSGDVAVLALSAVNHELGTVEDLAAISELATKNRCLVFCDLVQALGRLPLNVSELRVDAASISAHKIGGPKGVGALWLKPGTDVHPLIGGGGQERGRRPGTQATAAIAGFAAAAELVPQRLADVARLNSLLNHLHGGISKLGAVVLSPSERVCNTLCFRWPKVTGDVLVASLDLAGVAVSAGAACSSGTTAPSPVLLSLGLSPKEALEAVRVSLGPGSTMQQIDELLGLLPEIIERAKRF